MQNLEEDSQKGTLGKRDKKKIVPFAKGKGDMVKLLAASLTFPV